MYGKIYASIYDGSLGSNWKALVVFEQMIVLSDADGHLDMTPDALHRRTGIPIDIILEAIPILEDVDPNSRTPDEDGRRLIRIDADREWGWLVVNKERYRDLVNQATVVESTRDRVRRHRLRRAGLPESGGACAYCGEQAMGVDSFGELAVLACQRCSRSRRRRPLAEFLNDPACSFLKAERVASHPVLSQLVGLVRFEGALRWALKDRPERASTSTEKDGAKPAQGCVTGERYTPLHDPPSESALEGSSSSGAGRPQLEVLSGGRTDSRARRGRRVTVGNAMQDADAGFSDETTPPTPSPRPAGNGACGRVGVCSPGHTSTPETAPAAPPAAAPLGDAERADQDQAWIVFRHEYPRLGPPVPAEKAFREKVRDEATYQDVMRGLDWHRRVEWSDRPPGKIPYAVTFLVEERWQMTPKDWRP